MKVPLFFLLALLLAQPGAAATTSESKACETFNEGWNCTANCWEKSKAPCAEGAGACQANAKACGGSADAVSSWAAVALYGAAAVALVGIGWYFIDKAMDDEATLDAADGIETAAELDLLPSRALDGA